MICSQTEHPAFVVVCAFPRSPSVVYRLFLETILRCFLWTAHVHTWARQDDICEDIADDFLPLWVRGLACCNYEVFVGR